MNNEEKKRYLRQYKWYKLSVERIELELAEFKNKEYPTSIINDMPSSHNASDISDYIIKCDEIISKLLREKQKKFEVRERITKSIEQMESEEDKVILTYRYILDMSWEEIAIKLGYSYRQVTRMHGRALNNFEIIEK